MKQHKCIQLLNTFTIKELKDFDRYVKGLYGRQGKVIDLFLYVRKYLPIDYTSNHLDKEYMIAKVFNGGKDAAKNLSNLAGKLKCVVEEFLLFQKVKKEADSFEKRKLMIEIYKERCLDDMFFDAIQEAKKAIVAETQNVWTPLKRMQLHYLAFFTTLTNKNVCKKQELLEGFQQLDTFFLGAKLKYSSEIENRKNIVADEDAQNWFLSYLLEHKNKINLNDYCLLYFQLLQLLKTKNIVYYQAIRKDFLLKYLKSISTRELLNILLHLFNYIAFRFREGDQSQAADYLELYTIGLDKGILQTDAYLDANYFVNTVNVACRLERYNWATQFVTQYLDLINPTEQKVVEKLSNCILLYEKGKYKNALYLVKTTIYATPIFSLRLKVLELKCLVELKEKKEVLSASCEAFDMFIRRECSLAKGILEAYKNFVQTVKKIFLYKKKDKEGVLAYLKDSHPLVQKDWLEQKAREMKDSPF